MGGGHRKKFVDKSAQGSTLPSYATETSKFYANLTLKTLAAEARLLFEKRRGRLSFKTPKTKYHKVHLDHLNESHLEVF